MTLQERLEETTKQFKEVVENVNYHKAETDRLVVLARQLEGRANLLQELINDSLPEKKK